jgi:TolB-like protein
MSDRFQRAADPEVETPPKLVDDRVRSQLQRILASPLFSQARRPSQFLRFIVESTLADKGDRIKEYLIGVEVFGRPDTYEPKDDPIVRIEAGRLRKKLAEYYGGPGANDPVIISLPKGAYVPAFQLATGNHGRNGDALLPTDANGNASFSGIRRTWPLPIAAVVVLLAVFAFVFYVRLHRHSPAVPNSIAVLPFLDLRNGQAQQYLSDGMAEELTTGLAQFKDLRVVAATSAFQFRGKSEDVRKIGQALNAEALLEGSIRQTDSGLRIDAQLIDARNGYHLWSKAYDTSADNMFSAEHEIVEQTAHVLGLSVNHAPAPKRDTENEQAHDLYLQGRYLWHTRQLPDMLQSVKLFQSAIAEDPNYALAYAGLADSYVVMTINTQMSPAEALPRAKAALQRALELDPTLAQAHATLGLLKSQCEWDWRGGEQELRTAIDLEPNYAPAHHWAGLDYMLTGQFAAADAEFRKAQVLDPLSPMITEGLAENFKQARNYDEAIATVLHMPDPKLGWAVLAQAYIFKGMYAEALKVPPVAHPVDMNGYATRAAALVLSGDRAGGLKILEDLEHTRHNAGASNDYIPPQPLGWAYAIAGEKERAFGWLGKAYEVRDPPLANLKTDPGFDSLRSDPRYLDLLRKVGLGE